jgi:hypothetical protein
MRPSKNSGGNFSAHPAKRPDEKATKKRKGRKLQSKAIPGSGSGNPNPNGRICIKICLSEK